MNTIDTYYEEGNTKEIFEDINKLTYSVIMRYYPSFRTFLLENINEISFLSYKKAVEQYDKTRGATFSTYIFDKIRGICSHKSRVEYNRFKYRNEEEVGYFEDSIESDINIEEQIINESQMKLIYEKMRQILGERDFNIFYDYYINELTMEQIAKKNNLKGRQAIDMVLRTKKNKVKHYIKDLL